METDISRYSPAGIERRFSKGSSIVDRNREIGATSLTRYMVRIMIGVAVLGALLLGCATSERAPDSAIDAALPLDGSTDGSMDGSMDAALPLDGAIDAAPQLDGAIDATGTSTTMTVITVDTWENNSPSAHRDYTVDTILIEANYQTNQMSWQSEPYPRVWGETLPNGVTGNLWTVRSTNAGVTYAALSWDYIGNATNTKACCADGVSGVIFTMLSSLCDQGGSGICAIPNRRRSNMVRWPQIIPEVGTLRIVPSHVGVFSEHATQTFTAYDGATQLDVADVDWWISESPTDGQGLSPEEIATIDQNGVATILGTRGTVKVSACIPGGCGP